MLIQSHPPNKVLLAPPLHPHLDTIGVGTWPLPWTVEALGAYFLAPRQFSGTLQKDWAPLQSGHQVILAAVEVGMNASACTIADS